MPQAVSTVAPEAVEFPHLRLKQIRADLLNALSLSGSAVNVHETAAANALFLRALAQAHVLAYRASFHVTVDHRGRKSIDVHFMYDPELESF